MQRKSVTNEVDKLLDAAAAAVQKRFGKDSMARLTASSELATVKIFTPFNHWGLNRITGGGVPSGRLIELFGPFSSGKSLLIAHLIAECQKAGGIACLDDCEHAYDRFFGTKIGVDNDRLLYTASSTVEEVFDKMEETLTAILNINPDAYILYGWDSVGSVPSAHEKETSLEDISGYQTEKAKAITVGTRKMCSMIGKSRTALVVANQLKHNPSVMFGSNEYTPGGDAIPFWASIRMRLSIKEKIYGSLLGEEDEEEEVVKGKGQKKGAPKKSGPIIGVRGIAKAQKNKIVKPFQETEFDIMFDQGLVYGSGAVDLLVREGILIPGNSKGFYQFKGEGPFKNNKQWKKKELQDYFLENPEILEGI